MALILNLSYWNFMVELALGVVLVKQVLYHLNYALNPICFSYFSNMVLHFA
jgi:hypothetical protein